MSVKDWSWQRGPGEGNKLFALYPLGYSEGGHAVWRFRCDCGEIKDIPGGNVFRASDPVKTCGKCSRQKADFSWQRGAGEGSRLFALYPTGECNSSRNSIWLFRCDCGRLKEMPGIYAFRTKTPVLSCGCSRADDCEGLPLSEVTKYASMKRKAEERAAFAGQTKALAEKGYLARTVYVDGKPVKKLVFQ
jgi:hypothetical protein